MEEDKVKEIGNLIEEFKSHTKSISTVNENFTYFVDAYKKIKESIDRLNIDIKDKQNIEAVMNELVVKSENMVDNINGLADKINKLYSIINPLTEEIETLNSSFKQLIKFEEDVQSILNNVNKTNETIEKLDLNQINIAMESYNKRMQETKDIFEKDVKNLFDLNSSKIDLMMNGMNNMISNSGAQNARLEEIAKQQNELQLVISKVIDKNTFQMEYLYSVFDKWAEDRKVKTKK